MVEQYSQRQLINTNFLTQASDESYALGLVNEKTLTFLLNLNLLFFDTIAIGATDLLGNPLLYKMFKSDMDAFTNLYSNKSYGGQEAIKPILMGENNSIVDVAQSMIRRGTIHRLKDQSELEEHSQIIESSNPNYLWCHEGNFRIKYYQNIFSITELFNAEGLKSWSNSVEIIPAESLSGFKRWLSNDVAKDDLRCSQIYRYAEQHSVGNIQRQLKLLGETIYQCTVSSDLDTTLSTSGAVLPYVEYIHKLAQTNEGENRTDKVKVDIEDVKIRLPFHQIAELSIREITTIRNFDSFRKLRELLNDFRNNKAHITATQLQSNIDECSHQLIQFANGTDLQKKSIIRKMEEKESKSTVRLFWEVTSELVSPILISFLFPGGTPKLFAAILGIATFAGSKYFRESESGHNWIYPESTGETKTYSPLKGEINRN